MEQNPILLVGLERSGTTWLGKIFDSHPDTLYLHEPDSWNKKLALPLISSVHDLKQYEGIITSYINDLPNMISVETVGKLPLFRKHYYSGWEYRFRHMNIVAAKSAARVSLRIPLLGIDRHKGNPQIRLVWKSIESLGRLGVISRAVRNMSIIHIVRHPCGYIASVLRGERMGKLLSKTNLGDDFGLFKMLLKTKQAKRRGLALESLMALEPIKRLAWKWVLINEKAMDDADEVENVTLLRYEDLCEGVKEKTVEAFTANGLSLSAETSQFIGMSTKLEKQSYYSVFKEPHESATKWMHELSSVDIDTVERIVKHSRPGGLYFG